MKKLIVFENAYLSTIPSINCFASIEIVNEKLNSFFGDEEQYQKIINQTYENLDAAAIDSLVSQIFNNSKGIKVELLSNEILGEINGAYTSSGKDGEETIYLNENFLASTNTEQIVEVLLEEFGHSIDYKINGNNDTYGDEGAIFSALVRGVEVSDNERDQNDHHSLVINDQLITIEAAAPTISDVYASPELTKTTSNMGVPSGAVGTLVSDLIDSGGTLNNFSDTDGDSPAIAIIGTNLGGGTLYYSIDNGTSWSDVGTVSETSARVLYADSNTRLAFDSAASFDGTISDLITFKAWDRNGPYSNGDTSIATVPTLTGTYSTDYNFGGRYAKELALSSDRNTAFIAFTGGYGELSGFQIIDVSNKESPSLTSHVYVDGGFNQVGSITLSPDNSSAFVTVGSSGLQIFDVSNKASPSLQSTLDAIGEAGRLAVSADGNTAFVADGSSGLQIIDVTNKASPSLTSTHNTSGNATGVTLSADGNTAFVANSTGLRIIDVSDQSNPSFISNFAINNSYDSGTENIALSPDGDTVFAGDGYTLEIIDVNNTANPFTKSTYEGVMWSAIQEINLSANGNTAFVASGGGGLQIIDIGYPEYFSSLSDNIQIEIDGTAPTFLSAATNTVGTKVILTYNETLSATTAATSAFAVSTGGSSNSVTAATVSGSTVELNLTNTVKNDEVVTVAYSDPSGSDDANAIQDTAGNDVATLSSRGVTNNSTVAGTAPTFSSAATNTAGTKVILTYNEALSATTAANSAFAVTTGGVSNSVTAATVSGSTVELTLTKTVKNDEAVTVAYTDPSVSDDANAIQDNEGNDVIDLATTSVTNNSTVAGTPPTFLSAATNTAGTKVILTYNEALSATTAATSAFAVTYGGYSNGVTDIAISGSTVELTLTKIVNKDEAVTVAYTDPSVSNDTNAIQDSSGNYAVDLASTSVTNNSILARTAPTFSSAESSINIDENTRSVYNFQSVEPVWWEIENKLDSNLFEIIPGDESSQSAFLYFKDKVNYEIPEDLNSDNTYQIEIKISDDFGNSSTQYIDIIINDINEAPYLSEGNNVLKNVYFNVQSYFTEQELLEGWVDPEGKELQIAPGAEYHLNTNHGLIKNTEDGRYIFTPEQTFSGTVEISYQVSDGVSSTSYYPTKSFDVLVGNDDGDASFQIIGTAQVGSLLSIDIVENDPDGNVDFSYKWESSIDAITWDQIGNNSTYPISRLEEGKKIRSVISYIDQEGIQEEVITDSLQVAFIDDGDASFQIIGTAQVGSLVSIDIVENDPDGNGDFSYKWESSENGIDWTTVWNDSSFRFLNIDDEKDFRVLISYTDLEGFDELVTLSNISTKSNSKESEPYNNSTDTISTDLTSSNTTTKDSSINSPDSPPILYGVEIATINNYYTPDPKGFASINAPAPVIVTAFEVGTETTLDSIKDFDGNLHAGDNLEETASSYKYQGMLDVNGDGIFEAIFTNKVSKRWVTAKVDSTTGQVDFDDNGAGGGTRVVGIYEDPLIAEGASNGGFLSDGVTPAPANFGVPEADRFVKVNGETIDRLALNSQVRFQNDLDIDNLSAKHSGDYDRDGVSEVYWKTNDGTAYLRALMHADGNIRYANYQSEDQMSKYLTAYGHENIIAEII